MKTDISEGYISPRSERMAAEMALLAPAYLEATLHKTELADLPRLWDSAMRQNLTTLAAAIEVEANSRGQF